jgi:hypothetical protein
VSLYIEGEAKKKKEGIELKIILIVKIEKSYQVTYWVNSLIFDTWLSELMFFIRGKYLANR